MEASQEEQTNPLGLSLDFMFGRGYLWAQRQRLSDWITLESLRMEIPDLKFPFDARSGLDRFRHTRSLVREVEFAISEVGLGDLLTQAASHLKGFQDLQVRFMEDAAHVSLRLHSFGANTHISFRAALIPPEPARADEIHLSLYDYRAYGPLPYPARLLAFELMTSLLNTPNLRAPGRGHSFTIGIAGDILSFRPLKLLFLYIFPRVGWKLPDLSGVVLDGARIRPGVLTIRATSHDDSMVRQRSAPNYHLAATAEGGRALAAYEAKDLFAHADQALFDGQIRQGLNLLASYRDVYGLHPALVSRHLDCLLADPTPGNLAEVEMICRDLVRADPQDMNALMARPILALLSSNREAVVAAFDKLAAELRSRGETGDWILCELAAAQYLGPDQPDAAATRLREVLKISPRNRVALEALRELYERTGEHAGLEETLKRLTGVYTERDTLKATYLMLARHLMDRSGDLSEARMYLEKVLRLDPSELAALNTLGESYVLGEEPLRALKAFGSAARAAESSGQERQAGRLHFRVAKLWYSELKDAGQALLSCRRALSLAGSLAGAEHAPGGQPAERSRDIVEMQERADQLQFAAQMCEARNRDEEALEYWSELVPLLERLHERGPQLVGRQRQATTEGSQMIDIFAEPQAREKAQSGDAFEVGRRLIVAHGHLARLYEARDRHHAAASHWRRILELDYTSVEALERLESYLRQGGQPEQLIELYTDLLRTIGDDERSLNLHEKLAELYANLGLIDDAQNHLRRALEIDPLAPGPRLRMIELLRNQGRFATLRDALNGLLVRMRDRDVRWEVLTELGRTLLDHLDQPAAAARAYVEALQLRPTERPVLEDACRALELLVERTGATAPAPVGSETTGKLLEHLLIRLAEISPTIAQQREVLLKIALLAEERGDAAAAAEARQRAKQFVAEQPVLDSDDFDDIDRRLDAMLADFVVPEESLLNAEEPARVAQDEAGDEAGNEADKLKLGSFREKFQNMMKRPAAMPSVDSIDPDSAIGRVFGREATERVSAPQHIEEESELDDSNQDSRRATPLRQTAVMPSVVALMANKSSVANALEEVEQARRLDNPQALADAVATLLEIDKKAAQTAISTEQRAGLNRELGELLYYDLEDSRAALPYLEQAREHDPKGAGMAGSVLNALESIYEEENRVDARIKLLKMRLANVDSQEMATTYRLLLAQVVWDKTQDVEGARAWISQVLEDEPQHEAAHRLLAEIEIASGRFEVAADHLTTVLSVAGGGLDAVEIERDLADMLLNRLQDPARAVGHFESVLQAAPGDSQALEGVKQCQSALEDWKGYVKSLGRELGLLIGKPAGLSLAEILELDVDSITSALRVPASQIVADVAHIVELEWDAAEPARRLWGLAYAFWPEHVEALERRIDLDRKLEEAADLAQDLEAYADLLLDRAARFAVLIECANLREELEDPDAAGQLYAEAIAMVEDVEDPPAGLDEARRALKALQSEGEV